MVNRFWLSYRKKYIMALDHVPLRDGKGCKRKQTNSGGCTPSQPKRLHDQPTKRTKSSSAGKTQVDVSIHGYPAVLCPSFQIINPMLISRTQNHQPHWTPCCLECSGIGTIARSRKLTRDRISMRDKGLTTIPAPPTSHT